MRVAIAHLVGCRGQKVADSWFDSKIETFTTSLCSWERHLCSFSLGPGSRCGLA